MGNKLGESAQSLRSLRLSRDGFDHLLTGSDDAAEALFQEALGLDEENFFAHYGMGEVIARTNRPGEALSHYRRAVELAGPANRFRFIRGLALTLIRAGCHFRDLAEYGDAERYFLEALPFCTDPQLQVACHEGLSAVYQASGRSELAQREFSRAVDVLLAGLSEESATIFLH